MPNHRFTANFVACAVAALAFAATAQAQNNRTFVSTTGSDTNNCGPTTPCRTFAAALALTNPGGELVVLTSGGYGAFTVTHPVTITAIGVDASVTASSGNAVTIDTIGNVTINGLGLHGQGTGSYGVYVTQVGYLRLYDVTAEDFTDSGAYLSSGNLAIYDSHFNDNSFGLFVVGGEADVHNSEFNHNSDAGVYLYQTAGNVVVADSSAHYNSTGFAVNGGSLSLIRDQAVLNATGVVAATGLLAGSAAVQLSYCLIAQNTSFAYSILNGATISGTSPGTNTIIGSTSGGSLSAAPALQ